MMIAPPQGVWSFSNAISTKVGRWFICGYALLLTACSSPPTGAVARACYDLCPQTVGVGIISPAEDFGSHARSLATVTFVWQLRPFLPPPNQHVIVSPP